jgi:hypothetical protein
MGRANEQGRSGFGEGFMRIKAFTVAVPLLATPVPAGGAWAQPLPAPASYPPVVGEKDVVATHEISLDMAEKIAHPGIDACCKMRLHSTMVVFDPGGTMKAFLHDERLGPLLSPWPETRPSPP